MDKLKYADTSLSPAAGSGEEPPAAADETAAKSSITLDKTEFADALQDCQVGQPEELIITLVPRTVTDSEVTGEVTDVRYADEESAPESEPEPSGKAMRLSEQ